MPTKRETEIELEEALKQLEDLKKQRDSLKECCEEQERLIRDYWRLIADIERESQFVELNNSGLWFNPMTGQQLREREGPHQQKPHILGQECTEEEAREALDRLRALESAVSKKSNG